MYTHPAAFLSDTRSFQFRLLVCAPLPNCFRVFWFHGFSRRSSNFIHSHCCTSCSVLKLETQCSCKTQKLKSCCQVLFFLCFSVDLTGICFWVLLAFFWAWFVLALGSYFFECSSCHTVVLKMESLLLIACIDFPPLFFGLHCSVLSKN